LAWFKSEAFLLQSREYLNESEILSQLIIQKDDAASFVVACLLKTCDFNSFCWLTNWSQHWSAINLHLLKNKSNFFPKSESSGVEWLPFKIQILRLAVFSLIRVCSPVYSLMILSNFKARFFKFANIWTWNIHCKEFSSALITKWRWQLTYWFICISSRFQAEQYRSLLSLSQFIKTFPELIFEPQTSRVKVTI
jgi:hypothetical protein